MHTHAHMHKHTQLIEKTGGVRFKTFNRNVDTCHTHPYTDNAYKGRDWISAEWVIIQ